MAFERGSPTTIMLLARYICVMMVSSSSTLLDNLHVEFAEAGRGIQHLAMMFRYGPGHRVSRETKNSLGNVSYDSGTMPTQGAAAKEYAER